VVFELTASEVGLEHRGLRLLHLEHQHVVRPAAREQRDVAAGPDAADADDLAGDVNDLVLVREVAAVAPQRSLVLAPEVVHRGFVGDVR
jgi:hypothetical protein